MRFGIVLLWWNRAAGHHSTNRTDETNTKNHPWAGRHETVRPAVLVKSTSGDSDDTDSKPGVHECLVQVLALKCRHASIFSCLSVEDEVDRHERGSKDTGAIKKTLLEVTGLNGILDGALVAAKGRAEQIARRRESAWVLRWLLKAAEDVLLWCVVKAAEDSLGRWRQLLERLCDGKRPSEKSRHVFEVFGE